MHEPAAALELRCVRSRTLAPRGCRAHWPREWIGSGSSSHRCRGLGGKVPEILAARITLAAVGRLRRRVTLVGERKGPARLLAGGLAANGAGRTSTGARRNRRG